MPLSPLIRPCYCCRFIAAAFISAFAAAAACHFATLFYAAIADTPIESRLRCHYFITRLIAKLRAAAILFRHVTLRYAIAAAR